MARGYNFSSVAPFFLKIAYHVKKVYVELRKVIYVVWGMLIYWKFVCKRWTISECGFKWGAL